jgi:acetylornithine deacetylase
VDQQVRDKILKAVDDGFDDQIAYLQKLVSFRSQRGEERPIQDFFFRDLAARGFAVDRFEMNEAMLIAHEGGAPFSAEHSAAPIVVGTLYPREEVGHSLILQHHVDVVPVGPLDMWEHDPYGGEIVGNRLYGRGAGDMKAGASANVFALEALRRAGLRPAATVHLESVVEEEATGNGALQAFLQGYTAEAALVPEPEQETLVRAACGVLWFEVEVRGIPVHVHQMGEGANAIDAAYRVIGALREIEAKWNAEAPEYAHFSGKQLPANLNIGKIEGGDWGSSVPAWCRFQVRVAIQPGEKAQAKFREIEDHVAHFARADRFLAQHPPRLTQNGFNAEGYILEPGSEAEKVLGIAHEAAFGTPLETRIAPAYLDARVFALYHQIPVLCYGPKGYVSHGFDEYVDLESLRTTTKSMALFIAEWCGTEAL